MDVVARGALMTDGQQPVEQSNQEAARTRLEQLLRYFARLTPFEQQMIANMVQDIAELTDEGQEYAEAMQYIRRNYPW
jgi:hypothetical protein